MQSIFTLTMGLLFVAWVSGIPSFRGNFGGFIKRRIIHGICDDTPSPSDCMVEVDDCLDLLQINLGAEFDPADTEAVCFGRPEGCPEKVSNCIRLLPGAAMNTTIFVDRCNLTMANSGELSEDSHQFAHDRIPSRSEMEGVCESSLKEIPNCKSMVANCYEVMEDSLNAIAYSFEEMTACLKLFSTLTKIDRSNGDRDVMDGDSQE